MRRVGHLEGQEAAVGGFGFIYGAEEAPIVVCRITVNSNLLASRGCGRSFWRLNFMGFIDFLSGVMSVEMLYFFVNE